jgi:hypothetical protein
MGPRRRKLRSVAGGGAFSASFASSSSIFFACATSSGATFSANADTLRQTTAADTGSPGVKYNPTARPRNTTRHHAKRSIISDGDEDEPLGEVHLGRRLALAPGAPQPLERLGVGDDAAPGRLLPQLAVADQARPPGGGLDQHLPPVPGRGVSASRVAAASARPFRVIFGPPQRGDAAGSLTR